MTKEDVLSDYLKPSRRLANDIAKIEGDILILGAGGKMGPAMAKLAQDAINEAGIEKKIIAVSRFSEDSVFERLNSQGIETIKADLLNDNDLDKLPQIPNIIYLAGHKFGTSGNESYTWTMNSYLPGKVAEKFHKSNIVVFSSGNVYPLSPVVNGGMTEDMQASPVGEYAQSCLGRERVFAYFSRKNSTPMFIYRLNYANDVAYGVLLEIAKSVKEEGEIDLSMGNVNVIWQGDANEIAIRALLHCSTPPRVVNVTGPEMISVRWLANEFGKIFGKSPKFSGIESSDALLSNAAECFKLFGYPNVSLKQMVELIGCWVAEGGKTINKPTHFQERKGEF
ncbi:Nucleoside-diphosphate-sugar epimerase [Proteiniphilum saccharofermentans]|jgi:nucleoside-diphosphate-sugar epimerase|uniref:Nucleoside-diphosphate-sugar epimerase n=1 Tax=Proteiniphilum saccharofermentans TaxID=1642647 RepID=A0A1R3T704_9BACT|nr:NAD-dependent epimerase/dehydratase family protein [Proteiniphilum saccharofermentans]SCD22002.1 Nucleoside-diphosphate-sugar epimerase [Proteiniphilum saccharofermentans]